MFTAVAAWARCHAKLNTLSSKPGTDGPAAASASAADDSNPAADGSPRAGDGDGAGTASIDGGSACGSSGDMSDLRDTLPDPALDQLLPLVRFPLMSDDELAALAAHPLRHKSVVLADLLAEAQLCHAADEARQLQYGADSFLQVLQASCHAARRACMACKWRLCSACQAPNRRTIPLM